MAKKEQAQHQAKDQPKDEPKEFPKLEFPKQEVREDKLEAPKLEAPKLEAPKQKGRVQATDEDNGDLLNKYEVRYLDLTPMVLAAANEDDAIEMYAQSNGIVRFGLDPTVTYQGPCFEDEL